MFFDSTGDLVLTLIIIGIAGLLAIEELRKQRARKQRGFEVKPTSGPSSEGRSERETNHG